MKLPGFAIAASAAGLLMAGCVVAPDREPPRGHGHGGYGGYQTAPGPGGPPMGTPGRGGPRGDRDGDGVPNRYDRDRDNDGVPNRYDNNPNNPRRR